jgi:hypothetical protein
MYLLPPHDIGNVIEGSVQEQQDRANKNWF